MGWRVRRGIGVWWVALIAAVSVVVGPGACGQRGARPSEGPVRVVVSIPPLKGLVENVVPEGSEVRVLIPAGASPHGYEPTPSDVSALRDADLVVYVGLGLEGSVAGEFERAGRLGARVVGFARAVGLEAGDDHGHDHSHDGHSHGDHAHEDDGHGHDHSAGDPHLWLDAGLCETLIDAVEREVLALRPGMLAEIERGGEEARERVREADALIAAMLAPARGRAIVTDHDAFGRFCDRYGIEVAGVVRPGGHGEPSAGELESIRAMLGSGEVSGVFVEPQLDGRAAKRLAEEAGVPVGTLDPIGDGDWVGMMQAIADELARVLGAGEG